VAVVINDAREQTTQSLQVGLEHILTELKLVAQKIKSRLGNLPRNSGEDEIDKFHGLYLSTKEIDGILSGPQINLTAGYGQVKTIASIPPDSLIKQLEGEIKACRRDAAKRGLVLRLDFLQELYGLSQIEVDFLLISLLPEIDLRYQKVFAYWQDDISQKAPTINLLTSLLGNSSDEILRARDYFLAPSPLIKYSLISLRDEKQNGATSWAAKSVHPDPRITAFLTGSDKIDSRLTLFASLVPPQNNHTEFVVAIELRNKLSKILSPNNERALICNLAGAQNQYRRDIAGIICSGLQTPMLAVNVRDMLLASTSLDVLIPLVFREAAVQNATLFLEDFDYLFEEKGEIIQAWRYLIPELNAFRNWVLLGLEKEWHPERTITEKTCVDLRLSVPDYEERQQIWEKSLANKKEFATGINISDLAAKFKFNNRQILQAVQAARNLSLGRDPQIGLVTSEDIYSACRRQSVDMLNHLARKVQPVYCWDDIILPKDQMEQLHEICSYVRYYPVVYETWGYGRKWSLGRGLKVLFEGPSGTGKTMAAEVISNELKIDLYKVDLSTIVSKYIGETEKNLDRIFEEGQSSNAILFFDEADALFGKRSEVRDAHDRYANIETAYLLQKMDEYEGIVILATNLHKNMDEAFARRMHHTLEFPLPNEVDRYRIWQRAFPAEAPHQDVNLKFIARQFKISGGNIKNIALNSAFLAADKGGEIDMPTVIKATRREYQKIGKLCTESEFAEYYELVKR
jgi:ATP-dependent 26S proteasome regulatory subunit